MVDLGGADEVVMRDTATTLIHRVRAVAYRAAVIADDHLGMMIFAMRDFCHRIHKCHGVVIVGKLKLPLQLAIDAGPVAQYRKRFIQLLLRRRLRQMAARCAEQLVAFHERYADSSRCTRTLAVG